MTNRGLTDTERKLSKKLQRLVEDETGKRPKLMAVQRLIMQESDAGRLPTEGSKQERLSVLFVTHEQRLREMVGSPPEGDDAD